MDMTDALYAAVQRVHGRTPEFDPETGRVDGNAARARERFQCSYDLARLLGGESLESFDRCVQTLDRFEAKIGTDGCQFSLTWSGAGLFGGMIFHSSTREWSIHT